MSQSTVVGRLAPSPTGAQHLGNARTFLIGWLSVRARCGRLHLRIEDIDSPRIKAGAADQIIQDLAWLGLDWDESPVWQTQRLEVYRAALERLKAQELVYPCTCSRQDIELAASAPHFEHEGPRYPGTCSLRRVADGGKLNTPFAWRFRASDDFQEYEDGFQGRIEVPFELGGDFVVWKSTDTPAYQLAVVVDDVAQSVTEVLRGDDLISSTPRQLQLYDALGWAPPRFVHVPLVVGPDGRRLAKRHGDTRLSTFRARGIDPYVLIGLLAHSCGWLQKVKPVMPRDLIGRYTLDSIPMEPLVVTPELLRQIGYDVP